MKGVPIKFRAKDSFLGKTVYGDLIHYPDNHIGICPVGKDESAEVDPDSVAQLIGYDAEGNEVYEGDIVDAFFDGKPDPVFYFQALLLNNFLVPENLKNVKHIVRRNAE